MASAGDQHRLAERVLRWPGRRGWPMALAALIGLAVTGRGLRRVVVARRLAGGGGPSSAVARFDAYASCMRRHGIRDFPDPTISPGGGVAFQINGGPGSDLGRANPRFAAAGKACRGLLPGGGTAPAPLSAQKNRRRGDVGLAACARTASRASLTRTAKARSTAAGSTRTRPRSRPRATRASPCSRRVRTPVVPGGAS